MKTYLLTVVFIFLHLAAYPVNVADFGAKTDGSDATYAVRKALEYCKNNKERKLIFPKGRYEFYPDKATEKYIFISNNDEGLKRIAFFLNGFSNFEIDGQGSTFIFHGYTCPFVIENAQNIVIKNLSIDYVRTFHSEGKIIAINERGFDVTFDDKYPYKIEDGQLHFYGDGDNEYPYSHLLEFDAKRKEPALMAKDYWLWNPLPAEQLPGNVVHIQKSDITATVGNIMVFGSAYRQVPGFTFTDSRNLTISGVNIYHCGGMGIIAQRCANILVDSVNVTPSPGSNRVVSITADATHFVNCSGKITLKDCLFENQVDDATNIHGIYAIITKINSPVEVELKLMHEQQLGFKLLKPGQMVELVDAPALVTVGTNKIKSVDYLNKEYMLVQFENPIPKEIKVKDAVGSAEEKADVLITNCRIKSNRARGLLIGARGKVVIENNYFHVPGAAILFEGDASYWFEQAGVKDCTIKNNLFDNCNYGVWGNAVIQVGSGIKKEERDRSRYNSNITVENNTFKVFDPRLVNIYSVDNFTFRNNTIEKSNEYPEQNATTAPFITASCSNVHIDEEKPMGLKSENRWSLQPDGGILWKVVPGDAHSDHVEMSGKFISLIETYGVDSGNHLITSKQLIFPMLRTIPNDTHAHTSYVFGTEIQPAIKVNNRRITENVKSFYLKGILAITSESENLVRITRTLFPSVDKPCAVEKFTLANISDKEITVEVEDFEKKSWTPPDKGVYGRYEIMAKSQGAGIYKIKPKEEVIFSMMYSGRKIDEPVMDIQAETELLKRTSLVDSFFNVLQFHSPDTILNRMFDFAKIRAMESIYQTKNGLIHSPGGGSYYAAIWANDQAEYANPFFAYTGYKTAIESAMNSWKWFAGYMNPDYTPIPSSIIAEGTDYWNGAGDRGDMAMIAYGASRFALALGDRAKAKEIFPLIEWCIEYCKRKINANGVVASNSDELEGRFPAGDANLSTSSLLYDALISAAYLSKELDKPQSQIKSYEQMAKELKLNINRFFGANIEGFDTYRYYEGNDVLRSWICVPLTVGIFDRSKGTVEALFSSRLWTEDGLLSVAGDKTFWDRATLYGLRGAFMAGEREKALSFLEKYSTRRLLGDHVPYAVEAYPEGNQRHLSAESALYCRVVVEGMFGFRPTGFSSFNISPQLPDEWNEMELKNIIAFDGKSIDIKVLRNGKKLNLQIFVNEKLIQSTAFINGTTLSVKV